MLYSPKNKIKSEKWPKNLTATQIKGYKRKAIFDKINNKKNQLLITMKFYAAALLALSAAAVKVADLDAEIDAMMKTPPTCGDEPSQADQDKGKDNPEAVFDMIDADGSGGISA